MTERFAAPTTIEAALAMLAADDAARAVAGGTDLVVAARQGAGPAGVDRRDRPGRRARRAADHATAGSSSAA